SGALSVTVTSDKANKLKDPCFHRRTIHSYNIRMRNRHSTIQSFSARRLNIPHLTKKLTRLR
ncbi:hypothetical protein N7527_010291, partial [Penicillium freii]